MNVNRLLLACCMVATVYSCQPPGKVNSMTDNPEGEKIINSSDNSRSSLDWIGVYTGNLPCADCERVETMLELKRDLTYFSQSIYRGKSNEVVKVRGTFSWDNTGNKIVLSNNGRPSQLFLVGENKLFQLDKSGNKITGELADKYILTKMNPGIVEKYWKLTELMGKQVQGDGSAREPHLILKTEGSRVVGSGGCNSFTGIYQLEEGSRIHFSKIAVTRMACMNMETESQFLKVLEQADNYNLVGDTTLVLNKAKMAPLARFQVVYLK